MKFSELNIDAKLLAWQKKDLTKRLLLSALALTVGLAGVLFLKIPSLKYPAAPGYVLLILALLLCWKVFRLPELLLNGSWVGTVEEVGLKTVIRVGYKGKPVPKQMFFMNIQKEDGGYYDYEVIETVNSHPSEVEESAGVLHRAGSSKQSGRVSVMGMSAPVEEDDAAFDGERNRFGVTPVYNKGDTVVHFRGQRYLATYGKNADSFAVCPFCGEIVIPERMECYRCKAPVMK